MGKMLRPRAVAKRLGIGLKAVYEMIGRGEIPAIDRLKDRDSGRHRYLIDEDDVDAWRRKNRHAPRNNSAEPTRATAAA